jgi:hypothetical protein
VVTAEHRRAVDLLTRLPAGTAEMLLKRTGSGSCRSTRWWVEGTGGI